MSRPLDQHRRQAVPVRVEVVGEDPEAADGQDTALVHDVAVAGAAGESSTAVTVIETIATLESALPSLAL